MLVFHHLLCCDADAPPLFNVTRIHCHKPINTTNSATLPTHHTTKCWQKHYCSMGIFVEATPQLAKVGGTWVPGTRWELFLRPSDHARLLGEAAGGDDDDDEERGGAQQRQAADQIIASSGQHHREQQQQPVRNSSRDDTRGGGTRRQEEYNHTISTSNSNSTSSSDSSSSDSGSSSSRSDSGDRVVARALRDSKRELSVKQEANSN